MRIVFLVEENSERKEFVQSHKLSFFRESYVGWKDVHVRGIKDIVSREWFSYFSFHLRCFF